MLQRSFSLYVAAVLIWGSTFYAIRFQVGEIDAQVSVAWRFALAALLLFGWCRLRGLPLRFSASQHGWMALQGLMLFCINYILVYWATTRLTSGLIAVIFSTIVLMNISNSALFFRKRVARGMIVGALFGLAGIGLIFRPELMRLDLKSSSLVGMGLALAGTWVASLGNILSARNQMHGLPVIQSNAWGMAYGALILFIALAGQGISPAIPLTAPYLTALLYLALFGSVLAFGAYLTLVGRIGPEKAAYGMVLFPIVALGISTLFEGYRWQVDSALGVALVLLGNIIIILPKRRRTTG
jgi:drug/metabolite transporter (DMT)-like permease